MKLMVIDGNSIVNRAFYGIRMLNAPDGTPTNGIYGFLTILQKLLDQQQPQGVCVAFDLKAPTFRHEKYDGYKAQRKGMPDDLAVQMPLLKKVLDCMGIMCVEKEGFEADDLLGTMSRIAEEAGDTCVIVTGDKDSLQLITDKTTVLHVKTRMGQTETVEYTTQRFFEEYGFEPKRMVDLKALMGDSSDNIPGVAGVGEKTAMSLLHDFGGLKEIYENIDRVKDSVGKKLAAGKESAEMSYDLATIVTNVPVDFKPEQALWNNDFKPGLYDVFKSLGFMKFIEKYGLSPEDEEQVFAGECTSVILGDIFACEDACGDLAGGRVCIWCPDSLDHVVFHQNCTAYVLRSSGFRGDYTAALELLFSCNGEKVGHNIKSIQRMLLEAGIDAGTDGWAFDTALAAYLLDSTAGSYDVERLAMKYCGFEIWKSSEEGGQLSMLSSDDDLLAEMMSTAAALEAISEELEKQLRELGMETLYYEVELPLCAVLADMEHQGFKADREELIRYGEMLSRGISECQEKIYSHCGEEFNINSTKKLGEILFEKLGLPPVKKTKTGYSTNIEVLEKLRDKHPVVEEIIKYRQLTKLKSTYADGLLKVISEDGRIHTTFQMTVTATGRLSSIEPNLQNIPVRQELGSELRKMFVAKEGYVLVDADYSQIELRVLAHISGDRTMIKAFESGEDIHTVTASQVFNVPIEQVTHSMRSSAKAVNFGIVYGISDFSLAQDIGVARWQAREYMDSYFAKYSGVHGYMTDVVSKAGKDGFVTTLMGRRRYLPELKASNFNMRSFGERVAMNMPIQGTAADIIKLAMVRVYNRLKAEKLRSKLILQVHDELIIEAPEEEVEQVRDLLVHEMMGVMNLSVPLRADAGVGKSWFEAK